MPLDIRPKIIVGAIKRVNNEGNSGPHSPYGTVLCHILNYCIKNDISLELSFLAGGGYHLKRLDLCKLCHRVMDTGRLQDTNCGGDCAACMAEADDPQAINIIKAVAEIEKGEDDNYNRYA
jgi:hypothetical protein